MQKDFYVQVSNHLIKISTELFAFIHDIDDEFSVEGLIDFYKIRKSVVDIGASVLVNVCLIVPNRCLYF